MDVAPVHHPSPSPLVYRQLFCSSPRVWPGLALASADKVSANQGAPETEGSAMESQLSWFGKSAVRACLLVPSECRVCPGRGAAWRSAFSPGRQDPGRRRCSHLILCSGLATAACGVLQGRPQGSRLDSSCQQTDAHPSGRTTAAEQG